MPSKPSKHSRGRPKGAKPVTLKRIVAAERSNGVLYRFIERHIANDPKKHGSLARAYRAASLKFGGRNGLSRTTIDRRLETLRKAEPAMAALAPRMQEFSAEIDPLLQRLKAAFTADELKVIFSEKIDIPQWFIERFLEDRKAAVADDATKTRRK